MVTDKTVLSSHVEPRLCSKGSMMWTSYFWEGNASIQYLFKSTSCMVHVRAIAHWKLILSGETGKVSIVSIIPLH